jgi:hypothetical protein
LICSFKIECFFEYATIIVMACEAAHQGAQMVFSVQQAGETQITPVDKSVHCLLAGPRDRGFLTC